MVLVLCLTVWFLTKLFVWLKVVGVGCKKAGAVTVMPGSGP